MDREIAIDAALDEADLGSSIWESQAAHIHAQARPDLYRARRLVDVSAHQKTGVALRELADGFAPDVSSLNPIQLRSGWRTVGEQHVAGLDPAGADLVLSPLVAESENIGSCAADSCDAKAADCRGAIIDISIALQVWKVVISRYPRHREAEYIQAAKQVVDRCEVARVARWGTLSALAEMVTPQVADQQDAVNPSPAHSFEDWIQVFEARVDIPYDRQTRHGGLLTEFRSRQIMLWLMIALVATAAKPKPWEGKSSDIVVDRDVLASVDVLVPKLSDFTFAEQIFPDDCMYDWTHGSTTSGMGAITRVTYHAGAMKRRLTATVSRMEDHVVEYDPTGKKGFVTQWRISAAADGERTKVSLGTYIHAPPWPFRGMYFRTIHPAWTQCYEQAMDNLVEALP